MSTNADTAPELSNNLLDEPGALVVVDTSTTDDELLEKIVSGEVKLNFSYLPPRAIGPENLNSDPTKFPLGDPNKPPERVIYL